MNDIEPYVSSSALSKQGITAIGGIVCGAALLILGGLGTIAGIVAGAAVGIFGLSTLASKDPTDRKPGAIIAGAGALTIVSKIPLLGALAKPILGVGALALLGIGIWNGIKFLKGLKSRS
jgi:hypothetical protein